MEFIYHNSNAPLELAVCIKMFYNVTVFWVLSYQVKDLFLSLKIPKEKSVAVNRESTDNTMAKRERTKGQTTIYNTYTLN